jgi:glycosyltransferase involved in cell wall biosynthesis/O-antigen/teichoic acid export membrane protein
MQDMRDSTGERPPSAGPTSTGCSADEFAGTEGRDGPPSQAAIVADDVLPEAIKSEAATGTTGLSVISGGIWNSFSQALPQGFALIISVAAARYLGPDGMGRQSFIAFTMISLSQLISQGLKEALMRSIAEALGAGRRGAVRGLVGWALPILIAGGLAGGSVLAVAGLLGASPPAAWLLAGVECVLIAGAGVPWAVLTGSQKWRQASTVGLMTGMVAVPVTIGVLAAGGGITGMFAVEAVTAAVALTGLTVFARRALRTLPPHAEPARDLRHRTTQYAALATLMALATFVVWQRSEFFFLRAYSTDREIAFYSIAFAAASGLVLLPTALAGTLSPAFATLYGARDRARIRSGYWRAQRLLLIVSLPLLAGFLALGPSLIRIAYGPSYSAAGPVLLILLALFPLVPLLGIANALLVGLGALRFALVCDALGGLVTIALNFLLVPSHAAIGAAVADIGGQIAVVVPILIYASRLVGPAAFDLGASARAIAVSAAAGVVAWITDSSLGGVGGLAVGAAAGLALFLVLASVVEVVPKRDQHWALEIVAGRLGATAGRLAAMLIAPKRLRMAPVGTRGSAPVVDRAPVERGAPTLGESESGTCLLRLVVYSDATRRGGAELALGYLIAELDQSIEVIVVGVEPIVVSWIASRRPGATEVIVPYVPNKLHFRAIAAHLSAIRRLRPDILHASLNSPWSCHYAIVAGLLTPRTRVVAVENAPGRSGSRFQRALKRALSRLLAAHIAVGSSSAREIERLIGLRRGSLATIPNGVPDDARAIRTASASTSAPVIGMISRIDEQKGVELLVQALTMLPGTTAVVVGEGPALPQIRLLAERLGVSGRLHTPGFELDARLRLRDFDIFVLPSRMEALPLSILEAMLARLPVVASDVGSVSEAVLDGETGLLVPPDDLNALVAALSRLLADRALRERMGDRARAVALERFCAPAMARAYEDIYRKVTVSRAGRSRK